MTKTTPTASKAAREVLWLIGVAIPGVPILFYFMSHPLAWGQLSFRAVTILTNLLSSLDSVYDGLGTTLVEWLWGGFSVGNTAPNRFFSLSHMVPIVLAALAAWRIWASLARGSNAPAGIEARNAPNETEQVQPVPAELERG